MAFRGPKAHVAHVIIIIYRDGTLIYWFNLIDVMGMINKQCYIYVYILWTFNIIMECHIYVCIVNPHCCLSYLHYKGLHRSIFFSIEKKRGNQWQPRMFDAQGLLLKSQDLLLKSPFFPS